MMNVTFGINYYAPSGLSLVRVVVFRRASPYVECIIPFQGKIVKPKHIFNNQNKSLFNFRNSIVILS